MNKILLLFFIILLTLIIKAEDDPYTKLVNEKVSDEYCSYVIGNITKLIEDGYIYYDFFKEPTQPEGFTDYIEKIDFVEALKNISTINRTYFEFYRDIQDILEKSNDNHLDIYGFITPKSFRLNEYYYCIPFKYEIKENTEETNIPEVYIKYTNECNKGYNSDIINKIKDLQKNKIIRINDMSPFEYFENMGNKGFVLHSYQARYVFIMSIINQMPITLIPFTKEELKLSIQFDGLEDLFILDYHLKHQDEIGGDFKPFFFNQAFGPVEEIPSYDDNKKEKKNIKKGNFSIEKKYIQQENKSIWNYTTSDGIFKCKIDDKNKMNVLFLSSFFAADLENYDSIMDKCFSEIYSNDYKLVIIYSHNFGGRAESCVPFAQYVYPKITKPYITAKKSTDFISKFFYRDDKIINPKTCTTFTEKDDPINGKSDKYHDKIIHDKTKHFDHINIFQRKIMDKTREKYANMKTKKPTDIILFTDGLSVSCSSISIRKLQIHGLAILVGYNIKPDLKNKKIDASQCSSGVGYFDYTETVQNLRKLGFYLMLTDREQFDPNDYNKEPKIPMEFKIYPVDEVSNIIVPFTDELYDKFINESKTIFDKYNKDEKCNIENKFLFYETDKCDEQLNIEKAHGGYTCGNDGKWNKTHCIPAYCDIGYELNNERTECIKDPCQSINLQTRQIKFIKETEEIEIEPKNLYIIEINKKNVNFSIYSDIENLIFIYNFNHILEPINNGTILENENKIYVNFYLNITEKTIVKFKELKSKENDDDDDDFPIWAIILISLGGIIVIGIIILLLIRKRGKLKSNSIEEKSPILLE